MAFRMRGYLILIGVVAVCIIGATTSMALHADARASSPSLQPLVPGGPEFAAGGAAMPAKLTIQRVESAVAAQFGSSLLAAPHVAQYGSFVDATHRVGPRGTGGPAGQVDAWRVDFTGLSIPRPCPLDLSGSASCGTQSSLTVIVDDKTGQFVEAIGQ